MKILDRYDFDERMQERYIGTIFINKEGKPEKTHTYSYLHCRNELKKLGEIMGLDTKFSNL